MINLRITETLLLNNAKKPFDEINTYDKERKLFYIAVMHHNFIRNSNNEEENLRDAEEILPVFLENDVKLIFHGHQHMVKDQVVGKGNNVISVLATGSAGLDSDVLPENSRRYQIIKISDKKVRIYRRRFDNKHPFVDGSGCWVPDMLPTDKKIYSEFNLNTTKDTKRKSIDKKIRPDGFKKEEEQYDLFKIYLDTSEHKLRGKDILILAYPRREIELIDRVLDHKNRIYYEYLSVKVELESFLYFLFVGKYINIKATINHFLDSHELPSMGLTICTPRVESKTTGDAEFRTKNIKEVFDQSLFERDISQQYKMIVQFIDDYVWQNSLDVAFRKDESVVMELPYYIDQNIYLFKTEDSNVIERNEGLSLEFFDNVFKAKHEDEASNPISVILASGGMGKTTLCDKLVNKINSLKKKKNNIHKLY